MKDIIIIGGGPAGLTAALYASRAGADVTIIESGAPGGKLNLTAHIENYPGIKEMMGPQLAYDMYEQALNFGAQLKMTEVKSIVDEGDYKKVITSKDLNFFELNQQVPQLSYANMAQSLVLPDMSYTRTVRWVYDASRITWYCFLVDYNNTRRMSKNNDAIDHMRRRLRSMDNDREFQEAVGFNAESAYVRLRSLLLF